MPNYLQQSDDEELSIDFTRVVMLAGLAATGCAPALPAALETFVYRGAGCTGRERMVLFEKLLVRQPDGASSSVSGAAAKTC